MGIVFIGASGGTALAAFQRPQIWRGLIALGYPDASAADCLGSVNDIARRMEPYDRAEESILASRLLTILRYEAVRAYLDSVCNHNSRILDGMGNLVCETCGKVEAE